MKKLTKISILLLAATALLVGCEKNNSDEKDMLRNFTKASDLQSSKLLNDGDITMEVKPSVNDANEKTLLVGYPLGLIGDSSLFGTVIIKIDQYKDAFFGNMKLSHFELPIRTNLIQTTDKTAVEIKGCLKNCSELGEVESILEIPVKEINATNQTALMDFSVLGDKLNVISFLDGKDFEVNKNETWTPISSKTVSVDFSVATLVVDVETKYEYTKTDKDNKKDTKEVNVTSRWYLRLSSGLSPYFEARKPAKGVGFFQTDSEGDRQLIRRFSIYNLKNKPVKYYLKNIPKEHQAAFAGSFEDWNAKLYPILGTNILVYEFLDSSDPRSDKIVAGDIRYNVMEWDLQNMASYGGLGPSISHPLTGETFAAQVLIQGPTVIDLYTKWFKVNKPSASQQSLKLASRMNETPVQFSIDLNSKLKLQSPALDPRLHDPIARSPMDFIDTPIGYDYTTYMDGYFRDMVAHELGHNLGLRHNFLGNMADNGSGKVGTVSRSVMEYLNRSYRHLDRVGAYDVMAISYGYLGVKPTHTDWYCSDENATPGDPKNSAECSKNDASGDPITFLEDRISLVLNRLLNRGSTAAPEWQNDELKAAYPDFISALAQYAVSAPYTATTWTNFFGKLDRPKDVVEVPTYILAQLDKLVCNPDLDKEVQNKLSPDAKDLAQKNLEGFRAGVKNTLAQFDKPWPILGTNSVLKCLP